MANFKAFRWNFSLSTNSEIGRSVYAVADMIIVKAFKYSHLAIEKKRWKNKYCSANYLGHQFITGSILEYLSR